MMGHSHHQHDHSHHDSASLAANSPSNPGIRIARIGLALNLALVFAKGIGGLIFHSSSLLADAGHSAADILSDILTLLAIPFSTRNSNPQYPLGYGKVETLGTIGVSSLLLIGGIGIGLSSLEALAQTLPLNVFPPQIEQMLHFGGHVHAHSHAPVIADPLALWVAAGSIAAKEWLFRATKKIATETNSTVLLANAWHHRTDALTSLVALLAIAGGQIYPFLDPIGGCLVSLLILNVAFQSGRAACQEIVDRGVDAPLLAEITRAAAAAAVAADAKAVVAGARGTKSGAYYIVDVDVETAPEVTVAEFERVRDAVAERVRREVSNVKIVRVFVRGRRPEDGQPDS